MSGVDVGGCVPFQDVPFRKRLRKSETKAAGPQVRDTHLHSHPTQPTHEQQTAERQQTDSRKTNRFTNKPIYKQIELQLSSRGRRWAAADGAAAAGVHHRHTLRRRVRQRWAAGEQAFYHDETPYDVPIQPTCHASLPWLPTESTHEQHASRATDKPGYSINHAYILPYHARYGI